MKTMQTKAAVEMVRQFQGGPAHREVFSPDHLGWVKEIARRSRDEIGYSVTLRHTTVPAGYVFPEAEEVAERAAS
jgi:hypothetical protein